MLQLREPIRTGESTCRAQADRSNLVWFLGVGLAHGGVGIFRRGGRLLDWRGHGFGGGAEAEGREWGRRDEIWVEVHGDQMREWGEGKPWVGEIVDREGDGVWVGHLFGFPCCGRRRDGLRKKV